MSDNETVELRAAIWEKLADMDLHDDTGYPEDQGYQDAIDEFREWFRGLA